MELVRWSAECAERLLGDLPDRWLHVQGVAAVARRVGVTFSPHDRDALIAAAYLHDVGYAAVAQDSGLHSLDGARYLRGIGADDRVASLVAHHSCASAEAEHRGLLDELLAEFPRERSAVSDALCYCDMTVGPTGIEIPVAERLEDIQRRYGADHVVARAITQATVEVLAAVDRTQRRLDLVAVAG